MIYAGPASFPGVRMRQPASRSSHKAMALPAGNLSGQFFTIQFQTLPDRW